MKKIFLKILEFVITKTISLYLFLNKKKHVSYKSYYKSGILKSQLFNDKSKKEYYDNGSLRYETHDLKIEIKRALVQERE